jgi:hypothetical protein
MILTLNLTNQSLIQSLMNQSLNHPILILMNQSLTLSLMIQNRLNR